MSLYQVFKETALPGSLQPHSIYLIAPAARPDFVEIYVTGVLPTTVRRVIDDAHVQAMIDTAMGGIGGIAVVDDIAARNALAPTVNTQVLVLNASADPTVTAGSATYVYRVSDTTWYKVSESESQDVVLAWSNITGRPNSSPAAIDAAVAASHTHVNITELNKIGEDVDGNMTYDGVLPWTGWASTNW